MQSRKPRVTIKTIAERAGVTHPTVSRALREDSRVKESTRRRIQEIARELGYQPDPAMSALVAHRIRNIRSSEYRKMAVLDSWTGVMGKLPFHFFSQYEGICSRAVELGYDVEVFRISPDPASHQQLSRILAARGIRGVIVAGCPAGFPPLNLNWEDFSTVALGYSVRPSSLHYVVHDHGAAVDIVYKRLLQAGFRHIGFFDRISSEERNNFHYLSTYLRCQMLHGVGYDAAPPLLFQDVEAVNPIAWFRKYAFDAIIAGYHITLIEALRVSGIRVPEEVTVVAPSVRPEDEGIVAGVKDDAMGLGRWAVDLLHKMLLDGERGLPAQEYSIMVKGHWLDGKTLPVASQA